MFLYSFFSDVCSISQLIKRTSDTTLSPKIPLESPTSRKPSRESGALQALIFPEPHPKPSKTVIPHPFEIRNLRRLKNHLREGDYLRQYKDLYVNNPIEKMR